MNNKDWEQQLRDRLTDYEMPADGDLWEAIESRLDTTAARQTATDGPQAAPQPTAATIWMRRLTAAAAAVLLLIAGGGLIYNGVTDSDKAVTAMADDATRHDGGMSEGMRYEAADMGHEASDIDYEEERVPKVTVGGTTTTASKDITAALSNTAQDEGGAAEPYTEHQQAEDMTANKADTAAAGNARRPASDTDRRRHGDDMERRPQHTATRKGHKRISVGLLASNNMSGNISYAERMMMSPEIVSGPLSRGGDGRNSQYGTAAGAAPTEAMYLSGYEEATDHRPPLSVGLSLRYRAGRHLWLESGLQYTYLRSDFTHNLGPDVSTDRQHLHYLGVPLRVGCELLSLGGLSLYASTGAQADFCLSSSVVTNGTRRDLGRDRTQYSVDISAGIQYTFLPRLGIYAEPGMRHYFDNGSPIKSYIKEHNDCFNLKIGLRYDF